jgi:hypothetical protein
MQSVLKHFSGLTEDDETLMYLLPLVYFDGTGGPWLHMIIVVVCNLMMKLLSNELQVMLLSLLIPV